jgi:hypothetical protein
MIVQKIPYVDENGIEHPDKVKTYSDKGLQILQIETGRVFDNAVDTVPLKFNYEETTTRVEDE